MAEGPLYELWSKQADALEMLGLGDKEATVDELLYGGMAGGGKSACIRAIACAIAQKWPGSVVPIFRRTYPELNETHIRKILQEVPESEAKWSAERKELTWRNGSITEFRHCDRESDVYSYLSSEWQGLLIDEASGFTPFMISMLRSRVRRSVEPEKRASGSDGWHILSVYATNPGGESHRWMKEQFVDNEGLGGPWTASKDEGGLRRYFLRARLSDNPSLDPAEYGKVLQGIADPTIRRAMAEGDWGIFVGQMFQEFRYDTHVCEPFEVPNDWVCWTGQDWGISAPAACVWMARIPPNVEIKMANGTTTVSERFRTVVYREWVQAGLPTEDQALTLRAMSRNDVLVARYADPHCWDRQGDGGSIASDFIEAGWQIQRANNDRREGWARIHGVLGSHDSFPPELLVMSNCRELIRTLPEAPRSSTNVEDLDTHYSGDHVLDATRYGLMGGIRVIRSQRRQRADYRVNTRPSMQRDEQLITDLFGKSVLAGRRR